MYIITQDPRVVMLCCVMYTPKPAPGRNHDQIKKKISESKYPYLIFTYSTVLGVNASNKTVATDLNDHLPCYKCLNVTRTKPPI